MYAQPPAPRTRPAVVTVSSYLLYVAAAVSLISAVLSLTQLGTITRVYRDAYAGTSGEGAEAVVVATSVIGVVFNILFAVGLVILAVFNNRGRQGARITTWVVGGLSLCCSGLGVAGTALTLAAQAAMGTSWRADVDVQVRTELVVDGPFRWVRNPIVTGMAVTAAGLALIVPNVVAVAMLVLFAVSWEMQIRLVEEPYLAHTHGDRYRAYARRTGRFLPGIGRLRGPR